MDFFERVSEWIGQKAGTSAAVWMSWTIVLVWLLTGPHFRYSDTWQLVINTATTIAEFLMVFLIQRTQNKNSMALHLKLDELIRATKRARNKTIDLESLSERELRELQKEFHDIRTRARKKDVVRKK